MSRLVEQEARITMLDKHVTIGTRKDAQGKPHTISAHIQFKDGNLSIVGDESGMSSGQLSYTQEELDIIDPAEGFTIETVKRFFDVWSNWHLNNMRAGCVHQKANWDLSKKIEFVSYSVEYDTKRAIERTEDDKAAGYDKRAKAAMLLRLLDKAGIKPFTFSRVGPADEAYLSEHFEVIGEHDKQARDEYNKRLERYQKAVKAVKVGDRSFVMAKPVKPFLIKRTEIKTANWVRPDEHPDGVLTKPCSECGYEYGTKWLREEVPAEVLEFLRDLPSGKKPDPAGDFLKRNQLTFAASLSVEQKCPQWCDGQHVHGDKVTVRIRREDTGKLLTFPFWNSLHAKEQKEALTPYDVLAAISSDAFTPDTFEEFCSEFGYDTDSRKARATFRNASAFARKLRDFFSSEELEELSEIR